MGLATAGIQHIFLQRLEALLAIYGNYSEYVCQMKVTKTLTRTHIKHEHPDGILSKHGAPRGERCVRH